MCHGAGEPVASTTQAGFCGRLFGLVLAVLSSGTVPWSWPLVQRLCSALVTAHAGTCPGQGMLMWAPTVPPGTSRWGSEFLPVSPYNRVVHEASPCPHPHPRHRLHRYPAL